MDSTRELETPKQTWTVLETRNVLIAIVLFSALTLILRSWLLSPTPPNRPYFLNQTSNEEILESLKWYANNSMGSLRLDDNRCILEAEPKQVICKNPLEVKELSKKFPPPLDLKNDKTNWPYIWLTKAYDNEVALEFALFKITPLKVLNQRERATVLGTELVVEVEFKKTALTKVSKEILDPMEIKNLELENDTTFTATIAYLPNPYGYYMPIFPLPET